MKTSFLSELQLGFSEGCGGELSPDLDSRVPRTAKDMFVDKFPPAPSVRENAKTKQHSQFGTGSPEPEG
ncbi:MAG: hypothetical protein LAQ69_41685 [Acidobacteriia bacterium]|nr:hypothetical protein [Terriglobia bacterium]